jgi:hypothetical protein
MTNNHSAFSTISTTDLDSAVGGKQTDGDSCPAPAGGGLPPDSQSQSKAPRTDTDPLNPEKPPLVPLHTGKPQ